MFMNIIVYCLGTIMGCVGINTFMHSIQRRGAEIKVFSPLQAFDLRKCRVTDENNPISYENLN